jgi:glycosyltransferase involved in cell wall biosynthesis
MGKLTLLIGSLAGGGAEGVSVTLANGLVENGWSVDLVVLHLNGSTYLDRVSKKVNLVVLDVKHVRYASLTLLRYLLKNKPEKVLVFNYELTVLLILLRGIFNLKVKIIARNINTLSHIRQEGSGLWRKYIVSSMIDLLFCKVDHVINQCNAMMLDLITLSPELKYKSSVIYNPVAKHIEDYAKRVDFSYVTKQNYLLCVGRLERQKGFHYAIEGFAKVAKDFPNLRLKILGQGKLEGQLKELTVNLGVADRIDFEGFQKNMIPYYLYAKATILTSLFEGFPNVLIESISLNTPVVAFDCQSGPREIIQNFNNGFLVNHQDVQDLATKLKLILQTNKNFQSTKNTAKKYESEMVVKKYIKAIKLL